jgi:hypothetical protein
VQAGPTAISGKADTTGESEQMMYPVAHRGSGDSMYTREAHATRETPRRGREDQPDAREGWSGRPGVSERLVLPLMPGNAGGGKEPQLKTDARRGERPEIGKPINSEKCSETADGVTRESEGRSRISLGSLLCPQYLLHTGHSIRGAYSGLLMRSLSTIVHSVVTDDFPVSTA